MDTKTGRASDAYKKAFWNVTRHKDSMTPEMKNALQEGVDSEGGYLVPDEFERTLVQGLNAATVIRSNAHVITTSSGLHKIPVVASHGSAAWIDEEGAYTESDDVFGQVQLDAHKVGTIIKVSEELLNDAAFDLEGYISSEFARRIGDKEEEAFLNGNGSSKPTGILNATGGGEVGVTAASATAITADELIDLYFSLKAPYRKNAVWVLNDTTVKLIRKLKDNNGQYLWQPCQEQHGLHIVQAHGLHIFSRVAVEKIGSFEGVSPLFQINTANTELAKYQRYLSREMRFADGNRFAAKGLAEEKALPVVIEKSGLLDATQLVFGAIFPRLDLLQAPFAGAIVLRRNVQLQCAMRPRLVIKSPVFVKATLCMARIGEALPLQTLPRE